MPLRSRTRALVRMLLHKDNLERDLDEELESVLALLVAEKVRAGTGLEQARREAWIELDGLESVKVEVRQSRHAAALDTLRQDLRHALRSLHRSPGFVAAAVATLAIGIGATTALFGIANAVLVRDLPYRDPHRLVAGNKTRDGRLSGPVSCPDYFDLREQARSFSDLALVRTGLARATLTGGGQPELVAVGEASWNLFRMLGVEPAAGRGFLPEDENRDAASVALASHAFFERRFAGSPAAVGSVLHIDGSPVTVVGVLPRGFTFFHAADLFVPVHKVGADSARDSHSHDLIGRLAAGVTLKAAQSEVDAIAARLARQYPESNEGKGLRLFDLHDYMVWSSKGTTWLLLAAACLVLLIACGNVAGLLLARGQTRLGEMALRSALGAPRHRLLRQLLTESAVLAVLAGGLGVGLAYPVQALLGRLLPLGRDGVPRPAVDATVLLFALGISVLTGLVVGIVPALRGSVGDLASRLRSGPRSSEGIRSARLRSALVAAQVAVSVMLLIGSGLLARSLANLASVTLGFDPGSVLTARVKIQPSDHPAPGQRGLFFASLLEQVRALPGVQAAGAVSKLPIADTATDWPVWPADQPRPSSQESRFALARLATPGYFAAMGMSLVDGRDLAESDTPGSVPVVVVTEAVAHGLFPEQRVVGRHVRLGWASEAFEVVGVVRDARINGMRDDFDWAMYLAAAQADASGMGLGIKVTSLGLAVRTRQDPTLLTAPIRSLLQRDDPNAILGSVSTMRGIVESDLAPFRTLLAAVGLLSGVAILLTAVGLYGVLAYQVSQRSHELGIRMALGASTASVIHLVLRQGLTMVGVGIAGGLVGALPSSRLLQQLLYGIPALDLPSYLAALTFLATVATLACLLPAWRATRVNVVEMLRRDC
jgi:predicted permease